MSQDPEQPSAEQLYGKAVRFSEAAHAGKEWVHGKPFSEHYDQVEGVLAAHGFGTKGSDRDWTIKTVARLHDVVEKTPVTVEDIRNEFGDRIATRVDATTPIEPKQAYFKKTKASPDSVIVKLADRIANFCSYLRDGILPERYMGQEHTDFQTALYEPGEAEPLWKTLNYLVKHAKTLAASREIPPFSQIAKEP